METNLFQFAVVTTELFFLPIDAKITYLQTLVYVRVCEEEHVVGRKRIKKQELWGQSSAVFTLCKGPGSTPLPRTKAIALGEDRFPHMRGQVCGGEGHRNGKGKWLLGSWLSRGLVSISKCSASLTRACVLASAVGRALGCMKPLAMRQPEPKGHFFPTDEDLLTRLPGEQKH